MIKADPSKNLYVAGSVYSSTLIGSTEVASDDDYRGLVFKMSSSGAVDWVTSFNEGDDASNILGNYKLSQIRTLHADLANLEFASSH